MTREEVVAIVRQELERAMNVVVTGRTATTKDEMTEFTTQGFPGQTLSDEQQVCHPAGFASRAMPATGNYLMRAGSHPGSRFVMGHNDPKRKALSLKAGEAAIYSTVFQIRCQLDKILLGTQASAEPFVHGNQFHAILSTFLTLFTAHTHLIILPAPGTPTTPPDPATLSGLVALTALVQSQLYLSKTVFAGPL